MIRLLSVLFVLITLMNSCQDEQPPIAQSEMEDILTDLHISEAYAQLNPVDQGGYMTKNYDTMLLLYGHVFKKHALDTSSFKDALDWYQQRPQVFDQVYENVLAKLSLLKESGLDSLAQEVDSTQIINIPDTL